MATKISIVIAAFNRPDLTKRCLNAVREFTDIDYELIMIDDGSTIPGNAEIMQESADVFIKHQNNQGTASSWADGVEAAKGSHVCILDNDVIVTPFWLSKLIDGIERRGFMICESCITVIISALLSHQVGYFIHHNGLKSGNLLDVYAVGGLILFRRDLIEKIGNFDRELSCQWSDLDFSLRAKSMKDKWPEYPGGVKIAIDPTTVCYHPGWIDPISEKFISDENQNTRSLPELKDLEHKKNHLKNIQIIKERWGIYHDDEQAIMNDIKELESK